MGNSKSKSLENEKVVEKEKQTVEIKNNIGQELKVMLEQL